MNILYSNKNNPTLNFEQDVLQIAKPFFDYFGVDHFDYSRLYNDGSYIVLTTNFQQYHSYTQSKLAPPGTLVTKGGFLWDNHLPKQALADNASIYNLDKGIIIRNDYPNYLEFVDLAANINRSFNIENYFSKMDIINQFVFYFKDKASKLIAECYEKRKFQPKITYTRCSSLNNNAQFHCNKLLPQKYYLDFGGNEVVFSKREYECIFQLGYGRSAKEIANILSLSPRTVETHILKAKIKSRCFSTNDLINNFIKNLYRY